MASPGDAEFRRVIAPRCPSSLNMNRDFIPDSNRSYLGESRKIKKTVA
jgi:hypothetical protein